MRHRELELSQDYIAILLRQELGLWVLKLWPFGTVRQGPVYVYKLTFTHILVNMPQALHRPHLWAQITLPSEKKPVSSAETKATSEASRDKTRILLSELFL